MQSKLGRIVLSLPLTVAMLVVMGLLVHAEVTVQGKVEYWDRLAGQYKPAKNVHVEVEGDWYWRSDPDVQTDDNGSYRATVENPPWWWDNYDDVDIEVYAETPGLIQVFENMFAWYPYHAISREVNNVRANQTVTINLKIGGPQNNIGEAYYRTADETANAFLVHQEMLAHYRRLRAMGFPASDFDETEVIVPAAGITSYYNHFTGFVNLVVAGLLGTGNWTNLPTGNDAFAPYRDFLMMVRHEYSHAIHDEITGWVPPLGLNMPSKHHPEMETNRFIAFTEGWAEFLPLATLNMGGRFEPTPLGNPPGLNLPASGNHYAMEGEVVGVLWDLFDPTGNEALRHPATKTADGFSVPPVIRNAQTWQDRLSDPNLTRIRQVVRTYVAAWPVQTIGEFLETYRSKFPADLRALKAIGFNRDITQGLPEEHPATLSGSASVNRTGNTVRLTFTLTEPDAEDRPFVQIWLWHQRGNAAPTLKLSKTYASGWSGANRSVTESVTVPAGTGTPDVLWLIVSDEMQPTAHRLTIPTFGTSALPAFGFPLAGLFDASPDEAPHFVLTGAAVAPQEMPTITEQTQVRTLTEEDARKIKALRDLIKQASRELRDYAKRKEMMLRQERGLFKIAQSVGGLKIAAKVPIPFLRKPLLPGRAQPPLSPAQASALQAFEQWKDQTAAGKALARPLTAQDKNLLKARQQLLNQQIQQHQNALTHIAQLSQRLHSALNAIPFGAESTMAQEDAKRGVQGLEQTLRGVTADTELLPQLQKQAAILTVITK